ncbi:hypothetical protein [Legionella yabuuchiae]|uniref:hypothetical protein n=1 Tax=Legionella yabuuchiae TaxID=376727 RepID=UPI001054C652|nr:hypothetical protein [Legionella yabuuchiae]
MPNLSLVELFQDSGDAPKIIRTEPGSRPLRKDARLTIYPMAQLHLLLAELKEKPLSDFEDEDDYKIRYLLDEEYALWFGLEGFPGARIPAHYQLTGKTRDEATCLAAGNIQFSSDFKTIVAINNKSGDFRPSFESIKWGLAVLIHNREQISDVVQFSDTLCIESSVPFRQNRYTMSELVEWVSTSFSSKELEAFSAQPTAEKECVYGAPHRPQREEEHDRPRKTIKLDLFTRDPSLARPSSVGMFTLPPLRQPEGDNPSLSLPPSPMSSLK